MDGMDSAGKNMGLAFGTPCNKEDIWDSFMRLVWFTLAMGKEFHFGCPLGFMADGRRRLLLQVIGKTTIK